MAVKNLALRLACKIKKRAKEDPEHRIMGRFRERIFFAGKWEFGAGHKPGSVPFLPHAAAGRAMIIPLALPLPAGSSDQPESSDGQPSNTLLFGLAPDGACLAPDVTTGTGELLPHRFTLTSHKGEAVCFLWRYPPRYRDWALPSILPCGARTFLPFRLAAQPAIIRPTPNSQLTPQSHKGFFVTLW